MRGIHQAIVELKASDPDTALTERALRRLVTTNEIPCVRVGNKYLINMDILKQYLNGTRFNHTSEPNLVLPVNNIRPIRTLA